MIIKDIHSISWGEVRSVLFDLDGVIVDSEPLHFKAWREALLQFQGENLTWEVFLKKFCGRADTEVAAALFGPLRQQQKKVLAFKNKVFCSCLSEIPVAAEVVQFIKDAAQTFPFGLVSNALKVEVKMMLDFLKIKKYFDVVITADDVQHPKPAPDPYVLALKKIKQRRNALTPEHVLVIEDSGIGAQAALAAGIGLVLQRSFGHPDIAVVLQRLQNRS